MAHYANKCSLSQKQKIKDILRDAILVLCQNTVAHNMQLTVEALIGITIDNGEDIVLVNIQEYIGKQSGISPNQHVKSEVDAVDAEAEVADEGQTSDYAKWHGSGSGINGADDMEDYDDLVDCGENSGASFENVLKEECNVTTYDGQEGAEFSFGSEMLMKEESYFQNTDDCSIVSSAKYTPSHYFGPESSTSKSVSHWRGLKKRDHQASQQSPGFDHGIAKMRPKIRRPVAVRRKLASAPSTPAKEESWQQPASGVGNLPQDSTVEHITLYACTLCGAQMRSLHSLKRHKQSHEGVVFRCNACSRVYSRRDTLLHHSRICAAANQQLGDGEADYGAS